MLDRVVRSAPWISVGGVASLLFGLAWDARLHRLDPGLAAREGVLSLGNGGHRLFALGITLVVIGSVLFVLGQMARQSGPRRLFSLSLAVGLAVFAGLTLVSAASAQRDRPAGHPQPSVGAATLGGPGDARSPTAADDAHSQDGAAATPEQHAAATQLLEATRVGIGRFADIAVAEAAGYRRSTPYSHGSFGVAHFNNLAYNRDGRTLDAERPEGLVYLKHVNGQMRLLGALYVAPKGRGPTVGGPLTTWHTHDNLCIGPNGVALATAPGRCPSGTRYVGDAVEMLHVWIFQHPDGPFAARLTPAAGRVLLREIGLNSVNL